MNKIIKSRIFIFIIGGIIFGTIGICATTLYQSNTIEYSPTDSSWNVTNVSDALNDLYEKNNQLKTIKEAKSVTKYSAVNSSVSASITFSNTVVGISGVVFKNGSSGDVDSFHCSISGATVTCGWYQEFSSANCTLDVTAVILK